MTGMAGRVAGALVACGLAILLATALLGGDDDYRVKLTLGDAAGLKKKSDVKVAGIAAGHVRSIDLDERDDAIVTVSLDRSVAPIGTDARAAVRPVNLLGEKYVDLQPGDLRRPAKDGVVIPRARTSTPVELDDVLNMLDPDTRAGVRLLITEAGVALDGRGTDFNRLLSDLPPALDQVRGVLAELGDDNQRLKSMVGQASRVVAAVRNRRGDLGRLVDSASDALSVTADARADLGATVARAPAALGQLRATLGDLRTTSNRLRPAAVALRASAPPLTSLLENLPAFASAASSTLDAARDVSPRLARLGGGATPTVRRLLPTVRNLRETATRSAPVADWLADGGIQDGLWFLQTWGRVNLPRDGAGHLFGAHLNVSDNLYRNTLDILLGDKPGTTKTKRRRATPVDASPPHSGQPAPAGAPKPSSPLPKLPQVKLPRAPSVDELLDALPDLRRLPDRLSDLEKTTDGLLGRDPGRPSSDDSRKGLLDRLVSP
jgi:phospholipid/cholesterol/gamma-HCH transport system substrate-binding protein